MKRLAIVLIGTLLTLAGCGGSTTTSSSVPHNAADVTFVRGMIPHHEQAVEMSKLAATQASDTKIKDIASRIQAAQDPEIVQMKALLTSWGEKASSSSGGHGGMDMSGSGSATGTGMMTAAQMKSLDSAEGQAFDKLYASQMIEHHQGAVAMAKTEVASGKSTDAIALAQKIIAAQETEITELKALQTAL